MLPLLLLLLGSSEGAVRTLSNFSPPTIVELFAWNYTDVATECEQHLRGVYGAVQVSPPQEHIVEPRAGVKGRSWADAYSPTGFRIGSYYGTTKYFEDMVRRCEAVGVSVIVDVVFNNMVTVGNMYGRGGVSSTAQESSSYFDATDGIEQFLSPPFLNIHFNDRFCARNISTEDYSTNLTNVKNCRFRGQLDLDQSNWWVKQKGTEAI